MEPIDHRKFLYPPGGILIWIIILVELATFTAGIGAFAWHRSLDPDLFAAAQQNLSATTGLVNTLVLFTSGFFMAEAVRLLKLGKTTDSYWRMLAALVLGLAFLTIKGTEYAGKLAHGLDLGYSTFFTFYWLLTGFHFVHVLVGSVILAVLARKTRQGVYHQNNHEDVETGASFWHLCDLIWLLLFPVLYLMK
jgi:nitric oxide reductase NorE protein